MKRGALALAAVVIAAALGSCGGDPPAAPATRPSGLPELKAQAERWVNRAALLLDRSWMARLQFRQRLYGRVQSLRAFMQEAEAAAAAPPPQLIERGHALIDQAEPFDSALALLESVTVTLDQLVGYERVVELNMQPLDYYLLPRRDMTLPQLRLAHDNGVSLDSYRFDTLDALYELTARVNLLEVA